MLDVLRELVGADAVRPGDERWAVHGVVPAAVVAPENDDQAAAVLARASEDGWAVECAGAGTRLDWGRPPARVDVLLTAARMTAVHEYEPADLTAGFGAGLPLTGLGTLLARERQWLAVDSPGPGATLGGVVATAFAGPLRLGHGTPRDHVLGLTLVTGDGRVLRLGGRVVKNVAGYDLVKLVVGSRGTLGFVTRAHLRLRSLPERDATTALLSPEVDAILAAAQRVLTSSIEPAALELLSPGLARASIPGVEGGWALVARAQGNETVVAAALDQLGELAGAGVEARTLDERDAESLWAALAARETGSPLRARLADRPSELARTLALAREAVPDDVHDWALAAHVGSGIVRLLAGGSGVEAAAEQWGARLERARSELAAGRGTLILERAPRALLERLDPWGEAGEAAGIMVALKAEFDPAGVLSAGRFVM